jgi:hypothetical protein
MGGIIPPPMVTWRDGQLTYQGTSMQTFAKGPQAYVGMYDVMSQEWVEFEAETVTITIETAQ